MTVLRSLKWSDAAVLGPITMRTHLLKYCQCGAGVRGTKDRGKVDTDDIVMPSNIKAPKDSTAYRVVYLTTLLLLSSVQNMSQHSVSLVSIRSNVSNFFSFPSRENDTKNEYIPADAMKARAVTQLTDDSQYP